MTPRRNILFTGASSFTGFWFARALVDAGHAVTCLFTKASAAEYSGIRRRRVEMLSAHPGIVAWFGRSLTDTRLPAELEAAGPWDVFCHHAAEVGDYKSPSFDPLAGAAKSVAGVPEVMRVLSSAGCRRFVQSGTYFESGEGIEGEGSPAFSPYAVSKSLAGELTRFEAAKLGMAYTKFIMPNPFGPYEDRGFTWYLAGEWLKGRIPVVKTPDYLRDNLPVDLMASAYVSAVASDSSAAYRRVTPSGFAGRQGDFALWFARNLASAGFPGGCPLTLAPQTSFDEPLSRMNAAAGHRPEWVATEAECFWRDLAAFYSAKRES